MNSRDQVCHRHTGSTQRASWPFPSRLPIGGNQEHPQSTNLKRKSSTPFPDLRIGPRLRRHIRTRLLDCDLGMRDEYSAMRDEAQKKLPGDQRSRTPSRILSSPNANALSELAPCNPNCRLPGFRGPFPPPLLIRVERYSIVHLPLYQSPRWLSSWLPRLFR
jgi:hypothetical protein